MNLFRCTALLLGGAGVAAGQIPPAVVPEGVGVNIHFVTGHERDLGMIAAAGFKFVRMDFEWEATERTPGSYDWSAYDELLGHLSARGLRALMILDYSNPAYEPKVESLRPVGSPAPETGTAAPRHPDSVAAFARWAAVAAGHYRGRRIIWEIYNEPNSNFWRPKPNAKEYTALALAVAKAVREADPGASIVAPALSTMDWDFLEVFLSSGVLPWLDAVTVHPYRDASHPPESAAPDYARLRERIDHYAPAGRSGKIPILSGEWGYASNRDGVSVETQAAYAVRQQLFNLISGVPLSIWYDWKDDGSDPSDAEQNCGTVTASLNPKPAYLALQAMTRELRGFRPGHRLETSPASTDDYVYLFDGPEGAQKIVAWTSSNPHNVFCSPGAGVPREISLGSVPAYMAP